MKISDKYYFHDKKELKMLKKFLRINNSQEQATSLMIMKKNFVIFLNRNIQLPCHQGQQLFKQLFSL
jgi:hypothetical protein